MESSLFLLPCSPAMNRPLVGARTKASALQERTFYGKFRPPIVDAPRGQKPGSRPGGRLFQHRVPKDTETENSSTLCVLPNSVLKMFGSWEASTIADSRSEAMNLAIGTPPSGGSALEVPGCCRLKPAFRANGSWEGRSADGRTLIEEFRLPGIQAVRFNRV